MIFQKSDKWDPDECRSKNCKWEVAIGYTASWFLTVFGFVLLWDLVLDGETADDAATALQTVVGVMAAMTGYFGFLRKYIRFMSFRTKVCKALAGLELHVVQSADDLRILMDIDDDTAHRIINGDYDCLLNEYTTCKYIGRD